MLILDLLSNQSLCKNSESILRSLVNCKIQHVAIDCGSPQSFSMNLKLMRWNIFFLTYFLCFIHFFFRCSPWASLLPNDAVPTPDRLPGRQPAVSMHGLLRGWGHAGSMVSGWEDGGTRCHSGHLHRETHGAELLADRQVMETSCDED